MAWSIAFLIKSFNSPLPWVENLQSGEIYSKTYFHETILNRSANIDELGEI